MKVRETLQAELDGDAGMSNELSSKWTLWSPLPLFHVTISPVFTVTVLGEKVLMPVAVTVWLAAGAGHGRHQKRDEDADPRDSGPSWRGAYSCIPAYANTFTLRLAERRLPA